MKYSDLGIGGVGIIDGIPVHDFSRMYGRPSSRVVQGNEACQSWSFICRCNIWLASFNGFPVSTAVTMRTAMAPSTMSSPMPVQLTPACGVA